MRSISKKAQLSRFLLSVFFLFTCSCATLFGGKYQNLKVTTKPEGARVYKGKTFLCETPCFVPLQRAPHETIRIEKQGYKTQIIELETFYRWSDSFFTNLAVLPIFYPAAIFGWALDIESGRAWQYRGKTGVILEPNGSPIGEPTKRVKVLVVAPPQGDFELLSDEIAEKMHPFVLQKFKNYKVFTHNDKAEEFALFSYDHSDKTADRYRDELYYNLGADFILESRISRNSDSVTVESKVTDIYEDKVVDTQSLKFQNKYLLHANQSFFKEKFLSLISVIPNNLSFDLAATRVITIQADVAGNANFSAKTDPKTGFLGYLSGFSVGNIRGSNTIGTWDFGLRFPFDIRYNNVRFKLESAGYNPFANVAFNWQYGLIGIGPELSLGTPIGLLYASVLLEAGDSDIRWSKGGEDKSSNSFTLSGKFEFGILTFLTSRINLRVYLQSVGGDKSQWEKVFSEIAGQRVNTNGPTYTFAGLSIGYYFPSARSDIKGMF